MDAISAGCVSVSRSLVPLSGRGQLAKRSAAVVGRLQPGALDHRAHRPVDHEDALGEGGAKRRDARLPPAAHAATRRPSTWQIAYVSSARLSV